MRPRRLQLLEWLLAISGWVLVVVFGPTLNRLLFMRHPRALWLSVGVMLVIMFVRACRDERRKRLS